MAKTATGNRGGGRRSLGTSVQRGPTVQRSIRIQDELWNTIVFAARAAGMTVSEYIRDAVLDKLARDRATKRGTTK